MLVVGLALLAGAVVLLVVLRQSYVQSVQNPAQTRANDVAASLSRGTPVDQLQLDEGSDRFTQIILDDQVVAASANARTVGPLDRNAGMAKTVPVADADDEWVIVTGNASSGHTVVVGRELDPVVESVSATATALAIGLPLLIGLVGFTTWRFVGAALGPVDAIRIEVASLTATDLTKRVPVPTSGDEIEQLATTMNDMLDRLDAAQRQQRRFISDASHELRSPLAAIRQHAEVAKTHPDRTSPQELAETVLAEEAHLERLVDDLLLLARSDEGGLGLRIETVDLDDLVLEEAGRSTPNRVEIDTSGVQTAMVGADEATLRRAIRNLIDNANRHATSRIEIATTVDHDQASVTIHDDGPGIPARERDQVLRRFTRLDHARSTTDGGAGLGLAIVAAVVAAHDGQVTIDDSPLGGAAITIGLPITPDRGQTFRQ